MIWNRCFLVFAFCYALRRIIKAYDDYSVKNRREAVRKKSYFPLCSVFFYRIFYRYGFIMSSTNKTYQPHLMLFCIFVSLPQLGFLLFHFEKLLFHQKRNKFWYFFFFNMKSFLLLGHVTLWGKLNKRFLKTPTNPYLALWERKRKYQFWFY